MAAVQEASHPAAAPGRLAVAGLEDALSGSLTGLGVGGEWLIAPSLAAAGVDTDGVAGR